MPGRLRLHDLRVSRFPRILGLCQENVPEIAQYANAIQETLLYDKAAGEESWNGTWAEIAFNVSRTTPYVTLPRNIARIEGATVCDKAIPVENQFIQYLQFGNGRLRKNRCCDPNVMQVVSRNNAITFRDLTDAPQYIRIYINDERDVGKRVLLQGTDANGKPIYSTDVLIEVTGIFISLEAPFATSTLTLNTLTGLQKDVTYGPLDIYQVDPNDGTEILLVTMDPGEKVASYRRYFFNALPCRCCPSEDNAEGTVQVTALAKLELIPVVVDTDYLLLQSLQAFTEEAQALRLQEADTPSAQQIAQAHHIRAIRMLIGELGHYYGTHSLAVNFAPFGSAKLERVGIGMV